VNQERTQIDRRRRATPLFSLHWLRGRRRGARRASEREFGYYVDRYRRGEWALVIGILLLSTSDLILTMVHLSAGGREANPVMALALEQSEATFIFVKLATTVLGLMILLTHVRFRRVRPMLSVVCGLYGLVIVYHILLRTGSI